MNRYRFVMVIILAIWGSVNTVIAVDDGAVSAKDRFIARCSPPEGPSIEFGWIGATSGTTTQTPKDGFQEARDGFSNMYPLFIQLDGKSDVIYSVWGDTKPSGVPKEILDKFARERLEANKVIQRTEHFVSAVVVTSSDEVWLTTLVPSLGIGYFSYHETDSTWSPEGKLASRSSALKSQCKFFALE